MDQNERRERLIESYLSGLTEHLGDLEECLRELGREREELEWEGRDLDLGLKANEEEREWVLGYIEEIPRLRDRTPRSLVRHAEELGSEPQQVSKPI
jgi:chromosome segregation ATPase